MDVFDDLFRSRPKLRPSPEVLKMQAFFKRSVKEGQRAKITLRGVLAKDAARTVFKEFMVKDQDPNTVPFWEMTRGGVPADPLAVYNKYILESGDSQMNLSGPVMYIGFMAVRRRPATGRKLPGAKRSRSSSKRRRPTTSHV